jgi:7-cyano-7-deazaguanine reductase
MKNLLPTELEKQRDREEGLALKMKYGEEAIRKASLEIWDNPDPEKDYEIDISFPEFTCLCPRSGYPDFALIRVVYVPDKKIVELKSFKLYLNSFRSVHISHEEVTNRIYDEVSKKLKPRFLEVVGDFNPRGNVKTMIRIRSDAGRLRQAGGA